jgi:uncharacterized repeat protein (TIGR02543 family)
MNASLLDTAMVRAEEQSVLFSHTRPNGSSCFSANSLIVAENVAIAQQSADAVMDSWMNSEGHAANILNSSYTSIGIGCYLINGTYTWVQEFGTDSISEDCSKPANKSTKPSIGIARDTFSEAVITSGIIFGSDAEYTYSFEVRFKKTPLAAGSTTKATMYLVNPGFSSLRVPLINEVKWSSGNSKVASVSKTGKIKGVSAGSAKITAKTKYFSASKKISVVKRIKVTFSANGGKNLSKKTITVQQNTAIGKLPTVKRKNYVFKGWYTKKSGGKKVTKSTKFGKSTTLYAHWSKVKKRKS